jgi:hypothetical protein
MASRPEKNPAVQGTGLSGRLRARSRTALWIKISGALMLGAVAATAQGAAAFKTAMEDTAKVAAVPAENDSLRARAAEAEPPQGRKFKFDFYEIEDAELLADLWRLTGRDNVPEAGRYQVLKVLDDTVARAYLLREGTQVGRLPDSAVAGVLRVIRTRSGTREGRISQNLIGNFWNPNHPLAPFQWPTGLYTEIRHTMTVLRNSTPQIQQIYGGWMAVRPVPWAHAEIGGYQSRHGGGLSRNLYNPMDDRSDWQFWSGHHQWGYLALGVPGVKYELALDNRNFPEFFWLDPNGGAGSYVIGREKAGSPVASDEDYADGSLMNGWKRGGRLTAPRPNYSQTLRLKLGQIRYSAVFDPDVYNSTIHDLLFDELPAPFGQWGLGFVLAEGAAHTHIRFDLFPVTLGIPRPQGSTFRFFFLRLDLAVRDIQTFHIGLATAIHLDSPILRPGGNR